MKVKSTTMIVIGFVVGLLVGAVATFVFMGINTRKVMAIYADAQLQEMAVNAHLLRSGKSETLLRHYDDAIPAQVIQLADYHRRFLSHPNATLWTVQMYYESNPSVAIPARIQAILDSLPPRPPSSSELGREGRGEENSEADADTRATPAPSGQENASN